MALKQFFSFLILIIFLTGCSNEKKTYHENGKLKAVYNIDNDGNKYGEEKTYYSSGELKSILLYNEGTIIDSIITYNKDATLKSIVFIKEGSSNYLKNYKDNLLVSSGSIDDSMRPIGWWKFFSNGKVTAEEERIIIINKSIVNRTKIYTNDGLIDSTRSRLFEVKFPLEILAGKQYPVPIQFNFDNSDSENFLDKDYFYFLTSSDIKENFSNINKIKLDTLFVTKPKEFLIMLGFRSPGSKNFRGIIERHRMIRENGKLLIVKSQMFIDEKTIIY